MFYSPPNFCCCRCCFRNKCWTITVQVIEFSELVITLSVRIHLRLHLDKVYLYNDPQRTGTKPTIVKINVYPEYLIDTWGNTYRPPGTRQLYPVTLATSSYGIKNNSRPRSWTVYFHNGRQDNNMLRFLSSHRCRKDNWKVTLRPHLCL